jgi:hypothetical protein
MDPFVQANEELNAVLQTAKAKRKLVSQHKKRIRAHMHDHGLSEHVVGDFVFTLAEEEKTKFSKKGFLAWLDDLPGEDPELIRTAMEDYENETAVCVETFTCKRRKINNT